MNLNNINNPHYRVVLCRFNEINLKSQYFQKKAVQILKDHIINVFKREKLNIQSILTFGGGLVAYFPEKQIINALQVFHYIPGIHSFSPALNTPRDLSTLSIKILEYIKFNLPIKCSVRIKIKIINEELGKVCAKDILEFIKHRLSMKTKDSKNSVNESMIEVKNYEKILVINGGKRENILVRVEMREQGTFIFHKKINSSLGGMPIDSANCILSLNLLDPKGIIDFLATNLLIMRRGAIVSPIIFTLESIQTPQSLENVNKKLLNQKIPRELLGYEESVLREISKYYSEPLPVIICSLAPFEDYLIKNRKEIEHLVKSKESVKKYKSQEQAIIEIRNLARIYIKTRICAQLINKSFKRSLVNYGDRKMHYKAIAVNIGTGIGTIEDMEINKSIHKTNDKGSKNVDDNAEIENNPHNCKPIKKNVNFTDNLSILKEIGKVDILAFYPLIGLSKDEILVFLRGKTLNQSIIADKIKDNVRINKSSSANDLYIKYLENMQKNETGKNRRSKKQAKSLLDIIEKILKTKETERRIEFMVNSIKIITVKGKILH